MEKHTVKSLIENFSDKRLSTVAGAWVFYFLTSIIPLAFLVLTLFGVFAAVFMLKRGSIWAVSAIHTAWNFIQGHILGIRVSGNPKYASVFNSVNAEFGSVLNGGEFGLEGGLGVTAVLLLALLFTLMMPAKKSEIDNSQILF